MEFTGGSGAPGAPDQRKEDASLRATQRILRAVFDTIPHNLYVKDVDGRYVMVNKALARFAGRPEEELVGTLTAELSRQPADQLARVVAADRAVVESGEPQDIMVRLHHAERGDLWIRNIKLPLRDDSGRVIGSVGLGEDITAVKVAEEAARKNETLLNEAQRLAQVGSWELDLMHNVLTWSDEIYRIFEIDRNRFGASYDAFLAVVHPEDRAAVDEAYRRSVQTGEPYQIVHRLLLPGGRIKYVQEVCATTYGPAGAALRSVGTVQDITDRKLTEQALQLLSSGVAPLSGEAFFNELALQLTRLLNVEIGFVGKYSAAPVPRLRTIGLCIDGQIAPPIEFDLAGTPCETVVGKQAAVVADGARQRFPRHRVFADLNVSGYAAVPLFDKEHEPVGVIGVMSRGKLLHVPQVESMLQLFAVRTGVEIRRQQTEAEFQMLFEFSPDANLMVNAEGRITLANRQAEVLLGYSREELIGLSVEALMPETARRGHVEMRKRFLESRVPRLMGTGRSSLAAQKKDGSVFPVDIGLTPLELSDGVHVMVSIRDISARVRAAAEREALETQLRQSQKMEALGRLAGGVAHDFNNMLQVIKGYAEFAAGNQTDAALVSESLGQVMHAADRAAELTRHLLAFSRQRVLKRSILQLDTLVQDSLKMARRLLGEDIQLAVRVRESPPAVYADASLLEQVLINLCLNARDAMPDGGKLTIDVDTLSADDAFRAQCPWAKPGLYAVIAVSDTGIGMLPEVRSRVFEPFFTTKEAGRGTGLGLSMSYGIVQQHGGMIEVESALGQGTTFRVYLPAADSQLDEQADVLTAGSSGGSETILVAEDEPSVRKLVSGVLQRMGYPVIEAQDGEEALALFAAHRGRLGLVILDMIMPRLSGRDVYQHLRKLDAEVPVLFSTGYADVAGEEFAQLEGIPVLRKPYSAAELLRAVRTALD